MANMPPKMHGTADAKENEDGKEQTAQSNRSLYKWKKTIETVSEACG